MPTAIPLFTMSQRKLIKINFYQADVFLVSQDKDKINKNVRGRLFDICGILLWQRLGTPQREILFEDVSKLAISLGASDAFRALDNAIPVFYPWLNK